MYTCAIRNKFLYVGQTLSIEENCRITLKNILFKGFYVAGKVSACWCKQLVYYGSY